VFPLAGLVELCYPLLEGLRHRVLLSTVAMQAHEREETVRLSVFRFAVGEAGQPSKPPPVRRAGVSVVPRGKCLGGKGSEELRKRSRVLEPGLKVAGAGLDNSTRVEVGFRKLSVELVRIREISMRYGSARARRRFRPNR
jgi:hypothetical protein